MTVPAGPAPGVCMLCGAPLGERRAVLGVRAVAGGWTRPPRPVHGAGAPRARGVLSRVYAVTLVVVAPGAVACRVDFATGGPHVRHHERCRTPVGGVCAARRTDRPPHQATHADPPGRARSRLSADDGRGARSAAARRPWSRSSSAALDDEQAELLPRLLDDARRGLSVPRIALRYRLQTDVHGLDRSRHRVLGEDGRIVVELDVHGAAVPQVLGSVLAVARDGLERPRRRRSGRSAPRSNGASAFPTACCCAGSSSASRRRRRRCRARTGSGDGRARKTRGTGVPSERRWAMEVLGLRGGMTLDRDDISRRFRRLLRDAHPDHGGARADAAERIAELTEARDLLIGLSPAFGGDSLGSPASLAIDRRPVKEPVRVAVTGAAGQIGYSLLFRIASGAMLGPDQPVDPPPARDHARARRARRCGHGARRLRVPAARRRRRNRRRAPRVRRCERRVARRFAAAHEGHGAQGSARSQRRDLHRAGQGARRGRRGRRARARRRQPGQHQLPDRDEQRAGHPRATASPR